MAAAYPTRVAPDDGRRRLTPVWYLHWTGGRTRPCSGASRHLRVHAGQRPGHGGIRNPFTQLSRATTSSYSLKSGKHCRTTLSGSCARNRTEKVVEPSFTRPRPIDQDAAAASFSPHTLPCPLLPAFPARTRGVDENWRFQC